MILGLCVFQLGKKVETCLVKQYSSVLREQKSPCRVSLDELINRELQLADNWGVCRAHRVTGTVKGSWAKSAHSEPFFFIRTKAVLSSPGCHVSSPLRTVPFLEAQIRNNAPVSHEICPNSYHFFVAVLVLSMALSNTVQWCFIFFLLFTLSLTYSLVHSRLEAIIHPCFLL